MKYRVTLVGKDGSEQHFDADTTKDIELSLKQGTVFEEAEDFEVMWGSRNLGRYMVNSKEPYVVDLGKELACSEGDPYKMLDKLLNDGRIIVYKPNYSVDIDMFGEDLTITAND